MSCPLCAQGGIDASLRSNSGNFLTTGVTTLLPSGQHALQCSHGPPRLCQGSPQRPPHARKKVTVDLTQRFARPSSIVESNEPVCTAYGFEFKSTFLSPSTLAADHPIRRADGTVCLGGIHYLWDLVISHPSAARCGTSPSVGTAGSAASAAHKRKITKYTTAYDFPCGTLVPISFETGGYAHPDTMDFFKRYIKYGMSDGTATEPVWTPQTRNEYARRMHVVRTTLFIAIARTTANTLLHGANTLLVTGHTFESV